VVVVQMLSSVLYVCVCCMLCVICVNVFVFVLYSTLTACFTASCAVHVHHATCGGESSSLNR
jgi:hypothetical protein